MLRGLTSMSHASPSGSMRSSTCTAPWVSPKAAHAWDAKDTTRAWSPAGSRLGVTYTVSSNKGPSSGSGLSKIASACMPPSPRHPSTATSAAQGT